MLHDFRLKMRVEFFAPPRSQLFARPKRSFSAPLPAKKSDKRQACQSLRKDDAFVWFSHRQTMHCSAQCITVSCLVRVRIVLTFLFWPFRFRFVVWKHAVDLLVARFVCLLLFFPVSLWQQVGGRATSHKRCAMSKWAFQPVRHVQRGFQLCESRFASTCVACSMYIHVRMLQHACSCSSRAINNTCQMYHAYVTCWTWCDTIWTANGKKSKVSVSSSSCSDGEIQRIHWKWVFKISFEIN